jgi:thymidylate kinase
MKLIILEGGDRLGKSTIIEGLCKHFNYDNVTVRHFGKPPKGYTPEQTLDIQFQCFAYEATLLKSYEHKDYFYEYFPNIVIWNRSHLGEYVYSQMFRNANSNEVKKRLLDFEQFWLSQYQNILSSAYLITLTADPEFFLSKEDGNSFSNKIEDKTKELELFKEAHDFSIIANKLFLKVDKTITSPTAVEFLNSIGLEVPEKMNVFKGKKEILDEVIQFIK